MASAQEKRIDDLEQARGESFKKDEHGADLAPQETTRRGSVWSIGSRRASTQRRFSISDDVFGEITEEGPNYRDVWNLHTSHIERPANADRWDGWERLF